MGKYKQGIRDGTGPYKDSFRIVGMRKEIGEKCPIFDDIKKSKGGMFFK